MFLSLSASVLHVQTNQQATHHLPAGVRNLKHNQLDHLTLPGGGRGELMGAAGADGTVRISLQHLCPHLLRSFGRNSTGLSLHCGSVNNAKKNVF